LLGVQEGNFLAQGGATAPCTLNEPEEVYSCATSPGTVSIGNVILGDSGAVPNGSQDVLAVLAFQAISAGTTVVNLTLPSLVDATFADIPATVVAGTVTVGTPAPVPEPSTMVLMGIGLAGLARRQWRRAGGNRIADPGN
jgi:PEP-CTERM motif